MRRWIVLGVMLVLPGLVFGQVADEFTLRVIVGADTTPPTTPVISDVVPMSPYQIDITWGPVTDDTSVEGYRLYRDGVLLATTTFTSYSDTGLAPSTTYAYTVDAFDYTMNISSTSLPVSTTTYSLPPPTATSTPATTQANAVPMLRDLHIATFQNEAVVTFASYGPTRYLLRFGQTTEYELGSVSSNVYGTQHVSRLLGLEPGTTYHIELTLFNRYGVTRIVTADSFTTQPAIISQVPISVSNVSGLKRANDAVLTWKNPDIAFQTIRVVRSHLFYPQNPTDGVVVYEGTAEGYTDKDVFLKHERYFYSIFVITPDGRVSAPAVVALAHADTSSTINYPVGQSSSSASTSYPDIPAPPIGDTGLSSYLMPSDVFVTFESTTRTLDSLLPLPVGTDILVSIPFEAVPRHLKTILLSVYHPTDHSQITTYLLKLRGDGTAYEVNFRSSSVVGEGRLVVEVFDYENESVRRLSRMVTYVGDESGMASILIGYISRMPLLCLFGFVVGFMFLWWLLLLWRRRREDNQ